MKKVLIFITLIFIPLFLYSQQSRFDYVEGEVSIKRVSGELIKAQIADVLNIGDSVITGFDGFAELSLENTSKISIDSDTVFIISKKEKQGQKKNIFMVVLGKIGFKFDRLLNEPDIQTPATVAGVRGTEFTVVSSLDGSALYVVNEGSVAVESEGTLVVLTTEEGVEVPIGEKPGEKFEVKIGSVDFSGWLDKGNDEFEKDPARVLSDVTEKLVEYADEATRFFHNYEDSFSMLSEMRENMISIEKEKGSEAKSEYYKKEIFPKETETSNYVLNYRYFALSALSLRRYVLSSMYIDMKTKYILDTKNPIFSKFLDEYEKFLQVYEKNVVPFLVEADI
ncbi:MAG: FecR domain-containing protein [Spirochaetaceae bacterium]|nr:FecR domain-containing protein [Spirochaetaceae bacterium]